MSDPLGPTLSGHLRLALLALERARVAAQHTDPISHRETIQYEIASAESSIARALGLIVGPP